MNGDDPCPKNHPERRPDRGLDLEADPLYQERMWTIERIGWAVMAVVLFAAATGLFGHGPLSNTVIVTSALSERSRAATDAPPVTRVTFDRYLRLDSPSVIRISEVSAPDSVHEGERTLSLWLSMDYLAAVELGHMTPRPVAEQFDAGGVTYRFCVRDGAATIAVPFKAVKIGRVSGSARLNDAPSVLLGHFVYP
jgi:hypothetical protein